MPSQFASGKHAIAECDRCGFRYKLTQLKKLTIKTKNTNIMVCPECWEEDQPQLQLGMYPVNDPQAVRNPRPDTSYQVSGRSGLQVLNTGSTVQLAEGYAEGGSRIIEWGWSPVGGARDGGVTPNRLALVVSIGVVAITIV